MPDSAPRTLLVSEFDSPFQAAAWHAARDDGALPAARHRFVGVLRLAALLADDLLVTDAQLLDGTFFLDLGPIGVAAALGLAPTDPLPFVVVTGHADLGEALTSRLPESGSSFRWSSWRELPAGVARERAEEWARAPLPLRPYSRHMDLATHLASGSPAGSAGIDRHVERALTLAERLGADPALRPRSEFLAGLDDDRDLDAAERALLADWWQVAYALALADQHGARWLQVVPPAAPASRRRRGRGSSAIATFAGAIDSLAALPPSMYAELRYRTRLADAGSRRDPRDIAHAIRQFTRPLPRWRTTRTESWARIVLAMSAAALATLPDLLGTVRWPLAVITAALAATPYQDVVEMVQTSGRKTDAVLHEVT